VGWPLQDILSLGGVRARFNHPVIPRARLHCPPWCNTIAQLLGSIPPPPTSRVYAIHHTILVITISCKGQGVGHSDRGTRAGWGVLRSLQSTHGERWVESPRRISAQVLERVSLPRWICLPPKGTPPPRHSSRHGPQHTQHTASTAATPRDPQGRRQTPRVRVNPKHLWRGLGRESETDKRPGARKGRPAAG